MNTAIRKLSVVAPARLHFGFLDPDGTGSRRFGSVGLAVDAPAVSLSIERSSQLQVSGPQAQRVLAFFESMRERCGFPALARIEIYEAIPEHAGLGSGTQLALAVGMALSRLHGLNLSVRDVAGMIQRGSRSGIGVGAFESGGFLVDGGRGPGDDAPPVVARIAFPGSWRIVLVLDLAARGLHGPEEAAAFANLPHFPEGAAGRLSRLMLLQALPALAERDFESFSQAIGELQRVTGDHFSPAQGGRYASPRVARVLDWLDAQGLRGIGQSSWGPTGFAVVRSQAEADRLIGELRTQGIANAEVGFKVCAGRNEGGAIEIAGLLRHSALAG